MTTFRQFVENELPVPPGVDPEMWANPSYQKFWLAQNPQQQQKVEPQRQNDPKTISRALTADQARQQMYQREMQRVDAAINLAATGFETGGVVPPSLVAILHLNDSNRSLVADSDRFTAGGTYPFYKEKKVGIHTGRIRFKQGYDVNNFRNVIDKFMKERYKLA